MLTRLKVSGFKNLYNAEVFFGPFTCVAGSNGAGKSNLFDAIHFLSRLADDSLMKAALSVRSDGSDTGDFRTLFHRVGDTYAERMRFEADMIVADHAVDDLGQLAEASSTSLRYVLEIGRRQDGTPTYSGGLEVLHEELTHNKIGEVKQNLIGRFGKEWLDQVVEGHRTSPYISTESLEGGDRVRLSQDRGKGGRPKNFLLQQLPRTVLSTVDAAESPTALVARREMQSWRLFQLEPSALRKPDSLQTPPGIDESGAHVPATLYYLGLASQLDSKRMLPPDVYQAVAGRLSELIGEIRSISVDKDERRDLLTVEITDAAGTVYPARSLSDGTLRFLALAVLEIDPNTRGVLCFEEPENGIHPDRIGAILQLLKDIAVDADMAAAFDNPLRQVIINTHSPSVVQLIDDADLVVVGTRQEIAAGRRFQVATFECLEDTWRAHLGMPTAGPGIVRPYLRPLPISASIPRDARQAKNGTLFRPFPRIRVKDRSDLQLALPIPSETERT